MGRSVTSINSLHSDHKNARRRTDRSAQLIGDSLQKFGAARSIVIDEDNRILAGNGTVEGAKKAGIKNVRIIETDGSEIIAVQRIGLTEDEKVGLALADNRTADLSEWDQAMLHQLSEEHDISDWFSQEDLDELLSVTELEPEQGNTDPDDVPEPPKDPITKPGDLWILGNHRLLCGDSTNPQHVERLMDGKKADLCFTSPPYGQQRDYTAEGKEKVQDWDALMQGVFSVLPVSDSAQVLVNLGLIHRDGEWIPYWDKWLQYMGQLGWRRFGWYVWDQGPGMPGDWNGRLAPSHEFIWHFNKQSIRPRKTQDCVQAGKAKTGKGMRSASGAVNEWTHGNAKISDKKISDSVFRIMRHKARGIETDHPAVFPVDLPLHVAQSWDGLLYEPFAGSGTTLIAAEQLGRECYGMEISPAYCDVIVKRWEDFTGNTAVCEPSDAHFEQELDI
jgi:DNA modification methylase